MSVPPPPPTASDVPLVIVVVSVAVGCGCRLLSDPVPGCRLNSCLGLMISVAPLEHDDDVVVVVGVAVELWQLLRLPPGNRFISPEIKT